MARHIMIGCARTKGTHTQTAISLYKGALFSASVLWANARRGQRWILSAKYGLVRDFQAIAPYDETLDSATKRREWSDRVAKQIVDITDAGDELVVLAGSSYVGWIPALVALGRVVVEPLRGMNIGQRKQWLAHDRARLLTAAEQELRSLRRPDGQR